MKILKFLCAVCGVFSCIGFAKATSPAHSDSTLRTVSYFEHDGTCTPNFTWSISTQDPPLTYKFAIQNPLIRSLTSWTEEPGGAPVTGPTFTKYYNNDMSISSSRICLNVKEDAGQCKTCIDIRHDDWTRTLSNGNCNTHFTVSGSTDSAGFIILGIDHPIPGNVYRFTISADGLLGSQAPLIFTSPWKRTIRIPAYSSHYSVKLEILNTNCVRTLGNLCNFADPPPSKNIVTIK